jgi:hypothetical protein
MARAVFSGARVLRPQAPIATTRPGEITSLQTSGEEMRHLTYAYAKKAEVNFEPLGTRDFLERLAVAFCERWGLVIEILIEGFTHCRMLDQTDCSIDHFSHAYAEIFSPPIGYSPITMPTYRESFDPSRPAEILERTR